MTPNAGSSQGIRVLRARGLFRDRPETDQRVQFVRQGNGNSDGVDRHRIVRSLRLVMLRDGGGATRRDPRPDRARNNDPSTTLQIRKLADHVGDEIGPLQSSAAAIGLVRVRPRHLRKLSRRTVFSAAPHVPPACPSFSWKITPSSSGNRSSSLTLRSWSQKNLASARSARE